MRDNFYKKMGELGAKLTEIIFFTNDIFVFTQKAVTVGEKAVFLRAKEMDKRVDSGEKDIENLCLSLLLLEQPVARDMLCVSAALKAITDLERIGDYCVDICELCERADYSVNLDRTLLVGMFEALTDIQKLTLTAYNTKNVAIAKEACKKDDIVDDLFKRCRTVFADYIAKDPTSGSEALDCMMTAKYLERIGDHLTNLAEWVIYINTGVHPNTEEGVESLN